MKILTDDDLEVINKAIEERDPSTIYLTWCALTTISDMVAQCIAECRKILLADAIENTLPDERGHHTVRMFGGSYKAERRVSRKINPEKVDAMLSKHGVLRTEVYSTRRVIHHDKLLAIVESLNLSPALYSEDVEYVDESRLKGLIKSKKIDVSACYDEVSSTFALKVTHPDSEG